MAMKLFINECAAAAGAAGKVALDDLILTTALPTTGGSRMLENYRSLFDAEALVRLQAAGYELAGKANVGEFGVDLLGETSYFGACENGQGELSTATAQLLAATDLAGALCLDVNGAPRRGAALAGQVCVKPTYGTVSRYGTIAVACSGEAVAVTARDAAGCRSLLGAVAGHDDKDGTSLPQEQCARLSADAVRTPVKRVAVLRSLTDTADAETQALVQRAADVLAAQGAECFDVDGGVIDVSNVAWNILMSAELCNNVSRFDGVKYGYRSEDFMTIGELYTNSRTEAFGDVLKTLILFGSDALSDENYYPEYDKALRIRRLVCERFAQLFEECDAVLLPACAKRAYTAADLQADKYLAFAENRFTAPASISGLPAVAAGGVQLVGPAFSDGALLDAAELLGKEA